VCKSKEGILYVALSTYAVADGLCKGIVSMGVKKRKGGITKYSSDRQEKISFTGGLIFGCVLIDYRCKPLWFRIGGRGCPAHIHDDISLGKKDTQTYPGGITSESLFKPWDDTMGESTVKKKKSQRTP